MTGVTVDAPLPITLELKNLGTTRRLQMPPPSFAVVNSGLEDMMNGKPLEKGDLVLKLILDAYTVTNAAAVVSHTTHRTGEVTTTESCKNPEA